MNKTCFIFFTAALSVTTIFCMQTSPKLSKNSSKPHFYPGTHGLRVLAGTNFDYIVEKGDITNNLRIINTTKNDYGNHWIQLPYQKKHSIYPMIDEMVVDPINQNLIFLFDTEYNIFILDVTQNKLIGTMQNQAPKSEKKKTDPSIKYVDIDNDKLIVSYNFNLQKRHLTLDGWGIYIWDIEQKTLISFVQDTGPSIMGAKFHPSNPKLIVAWFDDGSIRFYDTKTKKQQLGFIPKDNTWVTDILFSSMLPEGHFFASFGDGTMCRLDSTQLLKPVFCEIKKQKYVIKTLVRLPTTDDYFLFSTGKKICSFNVWTHDIVEFFNLDAYEKARNLSIQHVYIIKESLFITTAQHIYKKNVKTLNI